MSVYRNDYDTNESPTISTIRTDAEDINVAENVYFTLDIRHARDWHPARGETRGFVPCVRHKHSSFGGNYGFFRGDDQETYDRAVAAGKEAMAKEQHKTAEWLMSQQRAFCLRCGRVECPHAKLTDTDGYV